MTTEPIVKFKSITKTFPGTVALKDVSIDISKGSCHALCGENGAGKSTLGKILAGIHTPDSGRLEIAGQTVHFKNPRDALAAGIGMVHQEMAFCENLSVAENLCLGNLPHRGPFVKKSLYEQAEKMLKPLDVDIDVRRTLGDLSIAKQQLIQIAAAVGRGAHILIFDEPTSSLSGVESRQLFKLIKQLQHQGVTSIYVSHHLEEIFHLCDTITVLRDGQVAGTEPAARLDQNKLVQMMIGRTLENYFPEHLDHRPGQIRLRVEHLSSPGNFHDISFDLRAGEILGMAGLVGAGRTQIAQALFGLDPAVTGKIFIDEKPISIATPRDALRRGLALIPEDRKRFGLILSMNARENISLPTLDELATWTFVRSDKEKQIALHYFELLRVKAAGLDAPAQSLSGGNQQKLVLARWLASNANILLIDEPTRGVDVGAKAEIHHLIDQLARQGAAILLISSELPEILNLSTRILIVRNGRIVASFARREADQASLMRLMAGITPEAANNHSQ
jgi:ABC-type sugar transport system ATPase subunit